MNAGSRLGLYGLGLVALLGGGAAVGASVGPIDTSSGADHPTHPIHPTAEEDPVQTPALPAGGLQVSEGGFTLSPEDRTLTGPTFSFTITGPDGAAVTEYDLLHDRRLHLILARRDLREYAHVHPTLGSDGVWSVDLPPLPPGSYRAFADFQPTGAEQHTLGVDLTVPGAVEALEPLALAAHDHVAGFEVELVAHGGTATVTVRRDGAVVTTEPYLGAAGHLVALREGDLAYLHVHPLDEVPSGPVGFAVTYPSEGRYALFFDFQVDGHVHTARFVVDADGAAPSHEDDGHGH